jgi:glucose-6-phosphate isomerase
MTSVTELPAWKALQAHYDSQGKALNLNTLFNDRSRFASFSTQFKTDRTQILLDYSKNIVTSETMTLLFDLCREAKVAEWRAKMFNGELINTTESRAVLHIALRNRTSRPIVVGGQDVMPSVNAVLDKMRTITTQIHSGEWTGYTGKRITDIVNIGIGGSDLGPVMVTEALKPYAQPGIKVHFVSNIDGTHVTEVLKKLDPETCLFIVASKTFTTIETITNATSAKNW